MALFDLMASVRRSKKTHRISRRHDNRRRLSLEYLEDRSLLSTFSVLNLDDSGAGSLRRAIEDANAAPGPDVIEFEVAGTIELTSGALPALTDTVNIDGTTARRFKDTPLVQIDANGFDGLQFNSGSQGSFLQSLGIVDAGSAGVTLNASHITLLGNFIGVELDGTTAAGNNGDGVQINATSSGNTIGGPVQFGPLVKEFNVISGNAGNGIVIDGSSDNEIIANFIGTDVTGMNDLGNGGNGILLTGGASSNLIGGREPLSGGSPVMPGKRPGSFNYQGKPTDGNVISGNDENGVLLTDGAESNFLAGNFIGTDLAGNAPIGNSLDGVAIVGADNNILRGTFKILEIVPPSEPFLFYNVISGNGQNGLRIHNSNNSVIQANFFGLGADNQTRVGNALNGVLIEGSSAITQFGGFIPVGNVTAANGQHGVEIRDTARGIIAFNTFAGLGAFNDSTGLGNQQDGFHITSTGGNNVLRTNVISGNGDDGIEISGDARGVTVDKAIIGLNTFGLLLLPNGDNGVEIGGNARDNVIGGFESPGDLSVIIQNTISGNVNNGVAIIGDARDNKVFNSFIGTDLLGCSTTKPTELCGKAIPPFGNGGAGVFLGDNTTDNLIGGFGDRDRNLISGNGGHGVELSGATSHNQIIANLIGTDLLGIARTGFGNQGAGVFLGSGTHHNTITDNTASGNGSAGFFLQGSDHNRLTGNSAVENTGDGFRLEDSNFNTLESNTAIRNDGDGFHVENSNHNKFLKNEAEANKRFGFFVDEIFDNIFKQNECELNLLGDSNLPDIC